MRRLAASFTAALMVGAALVAAPATAADRPAVEAANVAPRPIVTGWFGWWASDTHVRNLAVGSQGVVDEVSMFWWAFDGARNPLCTYDNGDYDGNGQWGDCLDGSATPWTTPKFERHRAMLQDAGIRIQASITDLSPSQAGQLSAYLAKAKNRAAYVAKIVDWAKRAGVDGVDLDMENFAFRDGRDSWAATKPRWVNFVQRLGTQLKRTGLTLSATVPGGNPPFLADGSPNPGTGYWVYAWDEIAPFVDRLIIMAYDYHFSSPGPIGPNDWAARVVASAVAQVGEGNAGRVWIGAPQYGRDWLRRSGSSYETGKRCPAGWAPDADQWRFTVTPSSARSLAAAKKVEPTWDAEVGEWSFTYVAATPGKADGRAVTCNARREVWFADTQSALARASIVPAEEIGGIAIWDFGTVNADFYPELLAYGREVAPVATDVTVSAPRAVAYGSSARVVVRAQSTKGPAAGATATVTWTPDAGGPAVTIGTATLDAQGSAELQAPVTEAGTWRATVSGSWARHPGASQPRATGVRWAVTLVASTLTPEPRGSVRLDIAVAPTTAGLPLRVQVRTESGWVDLKETTTAGDGTAQARVRAPRAGQAVYRVVAPASASVLAGTSAPVTITVRG